MIFKHTIPKELFDALPKYEITFDSHGYITNLKAIHINDIHRVLAND